MSPLDIVLLAVACAASAVAIALGAAYRRLAARSPLAPAPEPEAAAPAARGLRADADVAAGIAAVADDFGRLREALSARDAAGSAAQGALDAVMREHEHATSAADRLTGDVAHASASIERTVGAIASVSHTIASLSDTVDGVSAAIGELAVSINQVAGSAREASSFSVQADRKANDGGVAVERLVHSTREIADDIRGVATRMQELGAASDRIGNIVEAIDAIADQTNLLALNAAIEAARAGEHGRGFAVVADEVRKLAESSARSTREIGSLVKDIQAKIGDVVRSATVSGSKADAGLATADIAGRAIGDISKAVAEANRRIEEISLAAREQATSSSTIVTSVEQMTGLMRDAADALHAQTSSNEQLAGVLAEIRGHAADVERAGLQQRTAVDQLLGASRALGSSGRSINDQASSCDAQIAALAARTSSRSPLAVSMGAIAGNGNGSGR